MADDSPNELKAALAEGRALIVCGAGVSMATTGGAAPGWGQLIREGLAEATRLNAGRGEAWVAACEALLRSNEVDDWLYAASTIQTKLGGSSAGPWRAFFKERFGRLKVTNPEILGALKKLADAGNRMATTYYDHLISRALHWDRADWTNHERVIEALRRDPPAVWHIYGDYDHPQSIVFSQADYDRIVKQELPRFAQHTATLDFTLLFVGCGSNDVDRLLDWLHKGFSNLGDIHFVLTSDNDIGPWPFGVIPVRYGAHHELTAYLATLASAPRRAASFLPDSGMIGLEDRLKEQIEGVLGQESSVLAPGALGMPSAVAAREKEPQPLVYDPTKKPRRYVSYAWADRADPNREKEVDRLCESALARGDRIIRDKTEMRSGDRISDFMRKIGRGDRVYVFLSDKYLKSPFCMFELFEVWRNSKHEPVEFQQRVRLYVLDDAKIWKPIDRLHYAQYWDDEYAALNTALAGKSSTLLGESDFKRFRHMRDFAHHVADILALFADTVQPRDFDEFLEFGFDDPPSERAFSGLGDEHSR